MRPRNQATPIFPYGSEPPGRDFYAEQSHGNGFFATPLISYEPAITATVTFKVPGTYHYYCLIHGEEMDGEIVVTR